MYILTLNQDGIETEIALFNTVEEGRDFISQLKAYKCEEIEGFIYETLVLENIPSYVEIKYNNQIVPFTKFMFTEKSDIDIYWKEVPNLSKKGSGMVYGATLVDAYSINNEDLKKYIETREKNYEKTKAILEKKGYEVTRAYFGSEDGEAILYKKKNTKNWHFLTHLDPSFSEADDISEFLEEIK